MEGIWKKMLLILVLLAIWEIVARNSNPLFIPDPMVVAQDLIETIKNGSLVKAIRYSFLRITIATLLSSVVSIPIGLLSYNCRFVKDMIEPVIKTMRYIPVTAFYPLLIMWFGIDEVMKISFLFIATFVLCLDEVNIDLIETGLTIGMSKLQTIFQIQIPAILPSLLNSFVMMYGIGWTYIAVAETINAKYGLGFIIQQSSSRGRTDMVFMAIIVIMVVSVIFDAVSGLLIRKIFKWRFLDDCN